MKGLQILEEHIENLSRCIDYIEEHIDKQFSLNDLSKQARMSVWHFQKVFHALIGEPVKTYVRRRRLTHSSKLLIDSRVSLDALSTMAGFKSQEAFNRAFKQQFNLTPGAFRKQGDCPKIPLARASISKEYITAIFDQSQPPTVVVQELPKKQLIGIQGQFFSCFSDEANGPVVIPAFWRKLEYLLSKHNIRSVLKYWGLVFTASDSLGGMDQSTYAATFESSLRSSEILHNVNSELVEHIFQGGLYAVFNQQNPPTGIIHSLNYVVCIWLNQSDYILDDRVEFENYSLDYTTTNINNYFTYGIPIKKKS